MNEPQPELVGEVCAPNLDVVAKVPTEGEKTSKDPKHVKKEGAAKRGATEKASDDYCLERFKKNMRHSRSSKIKIA